MSASSAGADHLKAGPWTADEYVDLLQGALDYLQPGIAVYDPQDRLLFCNRRMREIYPEVGHLFQVGRPYADIARAFYQYRHDRVLQLSEDEYVAQRVAHHANPSGIDEEYHNHDGSWLLVWDRKTPNGCIIGFRLDITERKNAELKLRELEQRTKQELEAQVEERTRELSLALTHLRSMQEKLVQSEKLASLGHLVAGIAHEINTPLGNAQLTVSTLSDRVSRFRAIKQGQLTRKALDELLDDVEQGARLAESNLHRAASLVQDFKGTAVHRAIAKLSHFKVEGLLQGIEQLMHPVLQRHPQRFSHAAPRELEMYADAGALEQVISNLINNSLTHAFTDRPQGTMHLEVSTRGQGVLFSYSDDGAGMDPGILARIFDPFFTTKFGQGGSGLGMFVVYNLVTSVLGGTIEIDSAPGKGFRCRFEIPRAAEPVQASP